MMQFTIKHLFMLVACLFLMTSAAQAQRQVRGKITDARTGETLPGATVIVVGTDVGTVSDLEGKFVLDVPAGATELQVSYTGFVTQTQTLGVSNVLDFALSESTILDEVVIIGYGTVTRKDATGAVTTVNSDKFNQGAVTTPQELVMGKMAGVFITPAPDGGGGGTIRIRGGASLSANNDPLVVVDGVPLGNEGTAGDRNIFSFINPNDIETFTVLKDASAAAIYGSRASNGVILITTKKGALSNKGVLTFGAGVAVMDRLNQVDVLSAEAYRNLINSRYPEGSVQRQLLGQANTNWQNEIYRQGVAQDYNLEYSGSAGKLPFRASLAYTERDNILRTDAFQRTSAAVNLSPQFFNNTLQFNINAKHSNTKNRFGNRGAIGSAINFDPTQPVYDGKSRYEGYFTWTQPNGNPNVLAPHNPLALLQLRDDRGDVGRFLASMSVDYRFWFLKDLRANLNLGYDRSDSEGYVIESDRASFGFVNGGLYGEYRQTKRNRLLEYYMNYVKKWGTTGFDLMAGYSWQHFHLYDFSKSTNLAGTRILGQPNDDIREYYLLSTFGRLNLNFADRVLLTGSLRRDGSSRFSKDNRWGLFPAAAIAINVVNNDARGLNLLKLRGSYGETGQQDIGGNYYPYLPVYLQSLNDAAYQLGNTFINTFRPGGYDANIKWEQTATLNFGLDYGFWNNRINGAFDYFIRKTTDLINFVPVPAGTNLTNFISTNVGDMENQGVEFSLNLVPMRSARATWEIGGNVTYFTKNEITRLTATDDPNYLGVFTGGISGGVGNTIQIHSVGHAPNSFFVYEQVYDDKGLPVEGLYVDRNGDGQVTPADRYHYKNRAPRMFFGFYTSYNRKHWDFSVGARANVGNYVYNNMQSDGVHYNRLYNSTNYLLNIHSAYAETDFNVPQYFSDHFVREASFFRIDHITLGYKVGSFGKLRSMRIYSSVQNPVLVTRYKGLDPEIFDGIDNNSYPRSRTIQIGFTAGF